MNQKLILLGENLADVVHFFIFIELKLISSPCQMVYAIELTSPQHWDSQRLIIS